MTKTFLTVGLVSSFALLSACATGTDYKSSEKSVSETPAEKVAMKEAAMSTELCTDMGPQTPRVIFIPIRMPSIKAQALVSLSMIQIMVDMRVMMRPTSPPQNYSIPIRAKALMVK